MSRMSFSCDYLEGALPEILKRMEETSMEQVPGYGFDPVSESAKDKIRKACETPEADIYFLIGGTQTNAVVIDGFLHRYEGVIAAGTGHVALHEAGAIEYCGHKVLTIPGSFDKLSAAEVEHYMEDFLADDSHEHMVQPGIVYISQPTEYGSVYHKDELEALHETCQKYGLPLYIDGARLADALAAEDNDVSLPLLARSCEAFYIGGTKCGAYIGEAVVFPRHNTIPHFFTLIKEHGALLAKGRLTGIQFDTLFTDDLYYKAGKHAVREANRIRAVLKECGYTFDLENTTNQIFIVLENEKYKKISEEVELGFWEKKDESHTVVRIATSWATRPENTDRLCEILRQYR